MKQFFSKQQHSKFIKYFNIKNTPSIIEDNFYKKTYKYINIIKWVPWLKMIWIWNSISMNTSSKNSDIDLYIVTKNNRLWLARIIITSIFYILWVRKNSKNHSWRFCLSFFSTINWMDFSSFSIENDIYLYFWITYFKPILDYDNTHDLFIKKNESWANFSLYKDIIKNNKKFIKFKKNNISLKKSNIIFNTIWNIFEKIIKKIFITKTLKNYNKIWKPYWIIINDDLLKFHNSDIRKKISKSFK